MNLRGQDSLFQSRAERLSHRLPDFITIRAEHGGQADILLADAPTKRTLPFSFAYDFPPYNCRRVVESRLSNPSTKSSIAVLCSPLVLMVAKLAHRRVIRKVGIFGCRPFRILSRVLSTPRGGFSARSRPKLSRLSLRLWVIGCCSAQSVSTPAAFGGILQVADVGPSRHVRGVISRLAELRDRVRVPNERFAEEQGQAPHVGGRSSASRGRARLQIGGMWGANPFETA